MRKDSGHLKPVQNLSAADSRAAVCCDVTACAAVRTAGPDVPALRSQIGSLLGKSFPASFLKHSDDQTVVTLAAVGRAIEHHGLAGTNFADWAVVAAPRFLGRVTMVSALEKFFAEGAWGVSPHMIPHRSLHSVSGTVSQALGIHGPNFGVGGGPGCASEALLAAAALVECERHPGAWLVLSGNDPEPTVGSSGQTTNPGRCSAVALALRAAQAEWHGMRLCVKPAFPAREAALVLSVEGLAEALADGATVCAACWRLECGGSVELEQIGVGAAAAVHRLAG